MKVKSLSRVQLLATPWTAAHQAPLSMGFSRQEYWSGVPSPSPGIGPSYVFNRATLFCKICKSNIFLTIGKIAVSFLVSGDFGVCDLAKDELSWASIVQGCLDSSIIA